MDTNWAAENLHVIRTLMERSALYRRALTPIMFYLGCLGIAAGVLGAVLNMNAPLPFVLYWGSIGLLGLVGAFLITRRQAMKDAEPFWSPPTRRVSQALLPPIVAGGIFGLLTLLQTEASGLQRILAMLPAIWMVLYGCALTSAGFFMRRGMRVLGWVFVCIGSALLLAGAALKDGLALQEQNAHYLMAGTFGLLHLLCGIYLRVSKDNRDVL